MSSNDKPEIVSPDEWVRRTALTFEARSPELRQVDEAYRSWFYLRKDPERRGKLVAALLKYGAPYGVQWGGARQGSCRLFYAASGCISSVLEWSATTESRSGLRVTAPMGVQSRVVPDQRAGLRSRAWR